MAAAAYRRMRETETDQVIIVSGESGAGKTESTKYMVHHMVHMCQGGQMGLNDKILKVCYSTCIAISLPKYVCSIFGVVVFIFSIYEYT